MKEKSDTPWFKGFHDGISFNGMQIMDNQEDQEEYVKGFYEGRESYYDSINEIQEI